MCQDKQPQKSLILLWDLANALGPTCTSCVNVNQTRMGMGVVSLIHIRETSQDGPHATLPDYTPMGCVGFQGEGEGWWGEGQELWGELGLCKQPVIGAWMETFSSSGPLLLALAYPFIL